MREGDMMIGERLGIGKRGYYFVYLFMVGLILGILIVNIGQEHWITEDGLLNIEMVTRMQRSVSNSDSLFPYVLKSRILCVGILLLLSTTMVGGVATGAFLVYAGLSTGCLLSVAVIRYGIRGLMLVLAGILPQSLLFVPGFFLLFCFGTECNQLLYGIRSLSAGLIPGEWRSIWMKKLVRVFLILLFITAGCIVESYVNPKMMGAVLNIIC